MLHITLQWIWPTEGFWASSRPNYSQLPTASLALIFKAERMPPNYAHTQPVYLVLPHSFRSVTHCSLLPKNCSCHTLWSSWGFSTTFCFLQPCVYQSSMSIKCQQAGPAGCTHFAFCVVMFWDQHPLIQRSEKAAWDSAACPPRKMSWVCIGSEGH